MPHRASFLDCPAIETRPHTSFPSPASKLPETAEPLEGGAFCGRTTHPYIGTYLPDLLLYLLSVRTLYMDKDSSTAPCPPTFEMSEVNQVRRTEYVHSACACIDWQGPSFAGDSPLAWFAIKTRGNFFETPP